MVRDLPGNGIVVERLSHDTADVGELNQLCQGAADVERGEGLTFPLTGVDPLAVMIDATWKSPGRFLEPVLLVENRRECERLVKVNRRIFLSFLVHI